MDVTTALPLLGGQSPQGFMSAHWQKKPLLVRQAVAGFQPLLTRAQLFALAANQDVESRLLCHGKGRWRLRHGPFARRSLPPLKQREWTLLVQGVDLHDDRVSALMQRFRFVPDARLDDVMISYASDGGGVGAHFDRYDVFLLQAQGQRLWRIGRQRDKRLIDGLPLRILAHFEPEAEYLLDPGDMLYLPPGWAHDGVAVGECMTYSIGFWQPSMQELGSELLMRLADMDDACEADETHQDPDQPAVVAPASIPQGLMKFAQRALHRALDSPDALVCAMGEYLTEPKSGVWFDTTEAVPSLDAGIRLDRRTRMMYNFDSHIFVNGEAFKVSGSDTALLHRFADRRVLDQHEVAQLGVDTRMLLIDWLEAGWLHAA